MSALLSFAPVVTDFPWWGVVLIVAAVLLVLLAIFLPMMNMTQAYDQYL